MMDLKFTERRYNFELQCAFFLIMSILLETKSRSNVTMSRRNALYLSFVSFQNMQ